MKTGLSIRRPGIKSFNIGLKPWTNPTGTLRQVHCEDDWFAVFKDESRDVYYRVSLDGRTVCTVEYSTGYMYMAGVHWDKPVWGSDYHDKVRYKDHKMKLLGGASEVIVTENYITRISGDQKVQFIDLNTWESADRSLPEELPGVGYDCVLNGNLAMFYNASGLVIAHLE